MRRQFDPPLEIHYSYLLRNGKTDKRALEALARESDVTTQVLASPPMVKAVKAEASTEISQMVPKNSPVSSVTPPSSFNDSSSTLNTTLPASTLTSLPLDEKEKVEPSSLEDQTHMWSGYKDDDLPEKSQGRFIRNLRHQFLYLYRRLFGVVFVTNFAIFIAVAVKGANALQIGKIVVANIFVAILMRQDYVIDAFFTVFTSVPSS